MKGRTPTREKRRPIGEGMRAFTDQELTAAEEIFAEFLRGMPELGIHSNFPDVQRIVDESYGGDGSAYIWESFGNFLDQCIDEEEA